MKQFMKPYITQSYIPYEQRWLAVQFYLVAPEMRVYLQEVL